MATRDKNKNIPLEERVERSSEAQRRAAENSSYSDAFVAQLIADGIARADELNGNDEVRSFDDDIMARVADSERLIQEDRAAQDRMNAMIMGMGSADADENAEQNADNSIIDGVSEAYDNLRNTVGPLFGQGGASHESGGSFNFSGQHASGPFQNLLDYIGQKESGNNYNMMVGGRAYSGLTSMTINEVINMQGGMIANGHESTAVGKYQIIRGTMRGLVRAMGLSGNEVFDERMQDRMATVLMEQRGLNRFLRGEITAAQFQNNLAHEWASMPQTNGLGAYDNVGSNRALATAEEFRAQILSLG